MDERGRSGFGPDAIRRPRVVPVGKKDPADSSTLEFIQHILGRFDGIDAEIPLGSDDEITVEVVPVRLRKPGPREDIR
jgi:hypothetical protein